MSIVDNLLTPDYDYAATAADNMRQKRLDEYKAKANREVQDAVPIVVKTNAPGKENISVPMWRSKEFVPGVVDNGNGQMIPAMVSKGANGKISIGFDPIVAEQEIDKAYASRSYRDEVLEAKAEDDKLLAKARSEGYTGPGRKFVIPEVYKADVLNAMKLDVKAKVNDLFGVSANFNGHGQLSKYGGSFGANGITVGADKTFNTATGDEIADKLYAKYKNGGWEGNVSEIVNAVNGRSSNYFDIGYKNKDWEGKFSQKVNDRGDKGDKLSAIYRNGNLTASVNGERKHFANGKYDNNASVNFVYKF